MADIAKLIYKKNTLYGGEGGAIKSSNNTYDDVVYLTQAQYDALPSKNPNTLYSTPEGESGAFEPSNQGTEGQILTKTANGYEWADAPGGGGGSNPALKLLGGQPGVPLYYLGQSIGTHILRFNDYIILGSWQGGNNATRMMILDMDGNIVMSFNPGGTYGGGYNFYDCGNDRLKIDHNTYNSWSSTWVDIPNQTYTTTDPGWTAGSTDPTTSYDISPAYLANIGYDARYCIMLLAGQVGTEV